MAAERELAIPVDRLDRLIYEVRGQKVMFDANWATVYGVTTEALNQAVKRNADRFPSVFLFQLTRHEVAALRSQIVTSNNRSQFVTGSQKHCDPRHLPHILQHNSNQTQTRRQEQMSLANVEKEGSWIKVYDEKSKKISQMSSSGVEIVGIGSDFFVTEEGSWIKTYDANCRKIAQMSSSNITVVSAAGSTFTTEEGSWLKIYDKNCKKISQRSA